MNYIIVQFVVGESFIAELNGCSIADLTQAFFAKKVIEQIKMRLTGRHQPGFYSRVGYRAKGRIRVLWKLIDFVLALAFYRELIFRDRIVEVGNGLG